MVHSVINGESIPIIQQCIIDTRFDGFNVIPMEGDLVLLRWLQLLMMLWTFFSTLFNSLKG